MVLIFRLVDLSLRDKRLSRETKYLCEEYVKLLWMEKASSIGSAKRGSCSSSSTHADYGSKRGTRITTSV
jgi:hypothetical protein